MHWTRAASIILRFGELVSAVIPLGILATFIHFVNDAHASTSGRIIYGLVIACISSLASIVLFIPLDFTFCAFPLDFSLFVCWIVAFGLMTDLGSHCTSRWYVTNWEYYWGQWWHTIPQGAVTTVRVGTPHCGDWRANLAFSFISAWIWLISGIIGIVALMHLSKKRSAGRTEMEKRTKSVGARSDNTEAPPEP